MHISDITDPAVIRFLSECYEKTTRLRMKWNKLHEDNLTQTAKLHDEAKGYFETDVLKQTMVAGLPTITRDNKAAARNRIVRTVFNSVNLPGVADLKKEHSIAKVGLGDENKDPGLNRPDTDLTSDPQPRQRNVIYKDMPVFGRKAYLKSRAKIDPEKKYYFCETTSWEYGWRLKDSSHKYSAPKFGVVCSLKQALENRTGPNPDPEHYIDPATTSPGPNRTCII